MIKKIVIEKLDSNGHSIYLVSNTAILEYLQQELRNEYIIYSPKYKKAYCNIKEIKNVIERIDKLILIPIAYGG